MSEADALALRRRLAIYFLPRADAFAALRTPLVTLRRAFFPAATRFGDFMGERPCGASACWRDEPSHDRLAGSVRDRQETPQEAYEQLQE